MAQLRLVGVHDDGEHLLLESADGTEYQLPIDQNLRTSIAKARRIQPARGRGASGTFGPRDIQTRFRQGATVEEIVAESGWDADRVRRYEWPIVAERANIITVARKVLISTAGTSRRDSSALTLDEHINRVAQHFGFEEAPTDWNTYQQESGQWTISLDISLDSDTKDSLPRGVVFPARWSYNPANQSIYASNEAAYFLLGRDHSGDAPLPGIGTHDHSEDDAAAEDSAEQTASSPLTAVKQEQPSAQEELLDELENRRGIRDRSSASERKLADLLERARQKPESPLVNTEETAARAQENESAAEEEAQSREEPVSTADETEEGTEETVISPEPNQTIDAEVAAGTEVEDSVPHEVAQPDVAEDEAATDEAKQPQKEEKPAPKPAQRSKRTSVPSWDDIIFGNQRR